MWYKILITMNYEELSETVRKLKESMPEPKRKPLAIWISTKDYEVAKEIAEPHNTYGIECLIYNDIIIYESPKMEEGYYYPLYPIELNLGYKGTGLTDEWLTEPVTPTFRTEMYMPWNIIDLNK